MKSPLTLRIERFFSFEFWPEILETIVSNKFFGITFYLGLMGLPFCVFLTPNYWAFFSESPKFYLISFVCFFIPFFILANIKYLKNPFFILPFAGSFFLSSQTPVYFEFLELYLLFIGWGIQNLAGTRTKPPHIYTDFILEATTAFTWYGEAHIFWKTVLTLTVPLFLIICLLLRFFC